MAETTTQSAAAYSALGTPRDTLRLPADPFDGVVHMPAMHRAVKAYLTNQRQGNASTMTRGLVAGGNQKPWRQKGTGRARQGSIRAPNWPGGGTVFGPLPKDYEERIPRQLKALARKSAFNARAAESAIYVIDRFEYDAPKTARLRNLLGRLGIEEQKVLVLTDGSKPNVYLSGRNLPNVHVMPFRDVGTYQILWSDVVLIESAALGAAMTPLAEKEESLTPIAKRAKPAREAPAKTAKAAKAALPRPKAAPKRSSVKSGAKKATAKGSKPAPKKSAAKKSAAKKSAAKRGKKKGG
ncbi:MAG: 50S ribosomal protein L4 [Gemmatimonadaceae bacterium]